MGEGSPLFHSALELLAHAIEHYVSGQERDRRLMILHLANAVELVLKDACLDLGESIYKNPKETKNVWDVVRDLEKNAVPIPLKPVLELLIEERNNIQHRFGSENEVMANWYMERLIEFFQEFMEPRLSLDLRSYLIKFAPVECVDKVLPDTTSADPFASALQIADLQPTAAALTTWIEIEKQMRTLRELISASGEVAEKRLRPQPTRRLLERALLISEIEDSSLIRDYVGLQKSRAEIVHGLTDLKAKDAKDLIGKMIDVFERIRTVIQSVEKAQAADSQELGEEG